MEIADYTIIKEKGLYNNYKSVVAEMLQCNVTFFLIFFTTQIVMEKKSLTYIFFPLNWEKFYSFLSI